MSVGADILLLKNEDVPGCRRRILGSFGSLDEVGERTSQGGVLRNEEFVR